jgi:protoporphyrinogen oxidase
MDKVVILGGGYAGLGAAYRFGQLGVRTTLLEAGPDLGGLAKCCRVGGELVEGAYHHIKPEDIYVLDLIKDLGLEDKLRWTNTRMKFYTKKKIYGLSGPWDLLWFDSFNWWDKIQFSLGMLRVLKTESKSLEGMNAKEWIIKNWTENIYNRMLGPMLGNKFGLSGDKISAPFLHGRMKGLLSSKKKSKGGELMAYLHGSTQILTDRLEQGIRQSTDIMLDSRVEAITKTDTGFIIRTNKETYEAKRVVNTLSLNIMDKIEKNFPLENKVEYQGAICGIFLIRETLPDFYWLNIIDDEIPFKIIVNQSVLDDYPGTLIYCGNYVHSTRPLFKKSEEEIRELYLEGLRKMFGSITLIDSAFFRTPFATPIFDINFYENTKDLNSKVPGMVFAGSLCIYPGTRTLSSILKSGYTAAEKILNGG